MDVGQDDLDALLELSEADAHLARIQTQMDDLPEQRAVDERRAQIVAIGRRRDELLLDLERISSEQRRLEREIDQLTQRRDAEQARLYGGELTTQREIKSAQAEIAATEARLDDSETALLEIMERVEALSAADDELATAADAAEAHLARLEEERDAAAGALLAERAETEVGRDQVRERTSAPTLARYDEVRERRGSGTAVGELVGLSCSACRIEMPRAEVNELRLGDTLTTCPSCRRLLVVR